jgi:hypothetical protein
LNLSEAQGDRFVVLPSKNSSWSPTRRHSPLACADGVIE